MVIESMVLFEGSASAWLWVTADHFTCGLRLTGLVAQGSIPWMSVGFVALFCVVAVRFFYRKLFDTTGSVKEAPMRKKTGHGNVVAISVLETFWAIGTSSMAGALPA